VLDLVREQRDLVAHAAFPELPEVGKISANLCGIDLGEFG